MADDTELAQYAQELFQNVCAEAEAGEYKESVFFQMVTDDLIDAGEFDDAVYVNYQPANNVRVRVDGYCGDPMDSAVEEDEPLTLGLIISEFVQEPDVVTLTQREMGSAFNKLLTFVNNALKPDWRSALEHTSPEYELAYLIATLWSRITKIRLYLITNKKLSSRVDGKHAIAFQNRQVAYSVWDLKRMLALSHSTKEREVLRVDFTQDGLHPLRALLASSPDSPNPVYLAVMPGVDLAQIYDRWGARLLEQNVRVFLQARSKVNKGIKGTLEHEPELFFSFNNGLTTTAEAVRISEDGNYILSMDNLQIVNGGLVPQISRFANTQNKVSEADLFSNHPFHTRIQALSQRLLAPAKEGTFNQTKWFYERARGQYGDAQAYLTPGEKKKFLLQYPKNQKFTKTDLAKYLRVWEDDAYRVNLGAQKNFVEYAKVLTDRWAEDNTQFNEYFFHSLIAKKIIFNTAESLIPQRPWYEAGGYRAPLVVLSIGLIGNSVRNMGKRVDFERIWNEQQLDEPWREAICQAADAVNPVLMNPAQGYRNISEWAKKQRCWDKVRSLHVDWNDAWLSELISPDAERSRERESGRVQRDDNEIENQRVVVNQKPEFWEKVEKWLVTEGEGTEKERGCVHVAASMPSKIPTEKQCAVIVGLMHRIENEGCPFHMVTTS